VISAVVCAFILVTAACTVYYMTRLSPNAVLMYHCIAEPPEGADSDLYVSPEQFEAQLLLLKKMHYTTGFASDFGKDNTAILTFDDGYADFYYNAYPILKKHGAKATVFLIVSLVGYDGYLTWDMVREMAESGLVRFGSHTMLHTKLDTISGDLLEYELGESKRRIEEMTGSEVCAVCYPNGAYNAEVLEIAAKYYTHGFTTLIPRRCDGEEEMLAVRRCGIAYGCVGDEFAALVTENAEFEAE